PNDTHLEIAELHFGSLSQRGRGAGGEGNSTIWPALAAPSPAIFAIEYWRAASQADPTESSRRTASLHAMRHVAADRCHSPIHFGVKVVKVRRKSQASAIGT